MAERWAKVEELFFELVELEGESRAACLAELSRTDPELYEEVRELLEASDRTEELLRPLDALMSCPPPVGAGRASPEARHAPDPYGLIGRAFSHYEVLDLVGVGGMGVVYRAVDTRLGREVALKFLPPHRSLDETFTERFQREARAAAALDHPNVCTIHEIGETEDGQLFIAMPFYRGETVRKKISRGPLELEEALDLARQAARGLAAAHGAGLVHRDIKPANLIVTEGGRLRILDFGLVKAEGAAVTRPGLRPGTVAYMSPEQSRGEAMDHRTDLWSLGVVLYEMLTGRRPFQAGNDRAVLDAIRRGEPEPPGALREDLPAQLDALVLQLLNKDPEGRAEGAAQLAGQPARLTNAGGVGAWSPRGARRRVAVGVAGVVLLAAVALLWIGERANLVTRGEPSRDAGMPRGEPGASTTRVGPGGDGTLVRRASVLLPDSAPLAFLGAAEWGVGRTAMAISPDGKRLAYVAQRGESTQLFLRELDRIEVRPLPGTEGAHQPFFSPDGEWVGFFAEDSVKKVAARGGEVITLAPVSQPVGGAWGRNGQILVTEKQGFQLSWVASEGGTPRPTSWQPEDRCLYPDLLPGGRWILHGALDRSLSISSLETGRRYALTRSATVPRDSVSTGELLYGRNPQYLESGHIAYISDDGVLMALPFDLERFRTLGPAVPLVDGIRLEAAEGGAQLTVSRGGTFVYAPGANVRRSRFVWVDHLSGAIDTLSLPPDSYGAFDLSPRGERLLVVVEPPSAPAELRIVNVGSGDESPIRSRGIVFPNPRWWPDGRHVVYSEFGSGGDRWNGVTVRQALRGFGARDTLLRSAKPVEPAPDGRHVAVNPGDSSLTIASSHERLPEKRFSHGDLYFYHFSPDGRWLSFTDIQTRGAPETYVAPVDRPEERYRVTPNGGEEAVWTPDGESLVFRNGQQWLRVNVLKDGSIDIGQPRVLFEGPYLNVPGWSHDISPDGHRQLLLLGPQEATTNQLVMVTNWLAEVERAASARRTTDAVANQNR